MSAVSAVWRWWRRVVTWVRLWLDLDAAGAVGEEAEEFLREHHGPGE